MAGLARNLLLAAASLLLFLAGAELLARLAYPPPGAAERGIFHFDPDKVFALRPGAEGGFMGRRVSVNSHGHRDAEIPTAKPAGRRRVVVLGDSVTFGHGVDAEETWPERLEQALRAEGLAVDVVNTAVPGNGPLQEFYDAERALALAPDLMIQQFTLNDVTEPYRFLRRLGGTGRDYHGVEDVPHLHWLLSRHSAFYAFLRDLFARLRFRDPSGARIRERAVGREAYVVHNLIFEPERPELEEAWRFCLEWMQRIADLAADARVPLVLVASPFDEQLALPASQAHPQLRLRRFAESNGLTYVDLLIDLQRRLVQGVAGPEAARDPAGRERELARLRQQQPERVAEFWGRHFLDHGHLNAGGHRWVASLLRPVVRQALGVGSGALPVDGAADDQHQPQDGDG